MIAEEYFKVVQKLETEILELAEKKKVPQNVLFTTLIGMIAAQCEAHPEIKKNVAKFLKLELPKIKRRKK